MCRKLLCLAVGVCLIPSSILVGCLRGSLHPEGLTGYRVDTKTRFNASRYPEDRTRRDAEGDLSSDAPAEDGMIKVEVLDTPGSGDRETAPNSDAGCEEHDCSDRQPSEAYQVPTEPGPYVYPLGENGQATFWFADRVSVNVWIYGSVSRSYDSCSNGQYFSSDTDISPSDAERQGGAVVREDIRITIPFAVDCSRYSS